MIIASIEGCRGFFFGYGVFFNSCQELLILCDAAASRCNASDVNSMTSEGVFYCTSIVTIIVVLVLLLVFLFANSIAEISRSAGRRQLWSRQYCWKSQRRLWSQQCCILSRSALTLISAILFNIEISADACQPSGKPSVKPSTSYQPHFPVRVTLNSRHTTPVGQVVIVRGGVLVPVMLLSPGRKVGTRYERHTESSDTEPSGHELMSSAHAHARPHS